MIKYIKSQKPADCCGYKDCIRICVHHTISSTIIIRNEAIYGAGVESKIIKHKRVDSLDDLLYLKVRDFTYGWGLIDALRKAVNV